jgi:hypothetical protein
MTDFLMSNEEFLKKGLLPVSQPGFGWYHVKVAWITPEDEIIAREGEKGKFVRFSVRLAVDQRAVFQPDPDREDNALLKEIEDVAGSRGFFQDVFLGGKRMNEALRGMQRKLEREEGGVSAAAIRRAFDGGECWVKIFHGENYRNEPEEVVSKWYASPPERTFVHESERDAFLQQGSD